MKKTLMLVLVVALAFSCFAAVLTAGASTEIVQGTKAEGKNYFIGNSKKAAGTLDFESGAGEFYQNWSVVTVENGVAKVQTDAPAYPMRAAYSGFKVEYHVGQTYYFQLDLKFNEKVNAIDLQIWDTVGCKMDAAFKIVRGEGDVSFELVANPATEISGYNSVQVTKNLTYKKLDNGFYRVAFDMVPNVEVTDNTSVWYGIQGSTGEGAKEGEVVFDYIEHGVYESPKYYTIDWDVDYNNYTELQQAIDGQPAWGNALALDADWVDDNTQCLKIVAGAGTSNAQIGGFDQSVANIEGKKLVKHAAVTYFQYDIAVDGCEMVNIWTGGAYYTSVAFNGTSWSGAGNVSCFKAQELDSGAYRLSYFIDMTANRDMDFNLNVDSTNGGAVYIDNLVIAHEDYSAYLKPTAMYYFANTEDVSLDFDAKGKDVTSVKLDDVALTAEDYTIADGKLTIKASKLAGSELGKKYTLSVVTSASETAVTAEISQIDNRASVTAEYKGEALAAVTYNGTTAYEKAIALSLSGVSEGDEVTVRGTAALASKNAGSNKVVVSNLVLAGKDAAKYKLANTSVEIAINVDKLQLTIGDATVADKIYDGTTAANVTAGALNGVVEGDKVTVAAAGEFNSKDVATANKVVVTYTIDCEDAANYIAPVNGEVAKTISKASVIVTANAATKEEGAVDPELTYTATGLVDGDKLNGKLARATGETAGEYDITIGTLANDNYEINFTGAKLTVTAKSQPTPDPKPEPTPDTKPDEEKKGCFGVVGTASVVAFTLLVAATVVVCKRKDD